jgi:TIR domain
VRTSFDEFDLEGGDRVLDQIQRQLEACEEFLVLLTPLSIARQWILVELGAAWGLRKRLGAITDKLADDELPDIIRQTKAYESE